jgi:hypothetical protein
MSSLFSKAPRYSYRQILFAGLLLAPWSAESASSSASQSPYIDELKADMARDSQETAPTQKSYTEELKSKLGSESKASHIESLKAEDPENFKARPQDSSYTESKKAELPTTGPGTSKSGAIEAVQQNRSKLKPYKPGTVQYAAGLKLGASNTQVITAASGASNRTFRDFYGTGWFPDLQVFGEWQPLRSEDWGSVGLTASGGFTLQTGKGKFAVQLTKPSGEAFPDESQTSLRFMTFPALLGANLRINAAKYVRPYIQGGAGAVVFMESRSDNKDGKRGYSRVAHFTGGLNILLDPIFPRETWDVYEGYTTKHYYLTVDYTAMRTISGNIKFETSTIGVGVTHEF